jgi:hypothetical protein
VWLRLYLGQDGTETWTVFQLFAVVPGGGCPNHKRERLDGCDDCDRDKEWDRGWLGPEAASFSGMIEALRLEASSWRDEVYNREDVQEDGQ